MNCITIELCAEDRARIDRLINALERKACDSCVATALEFAGKAKPAEPDPIQQKQADTLAKASEPTVASENATHTPSEAPASQTMHPVDEALPWDDPAPAPVPVPSLEEFQKALTLRCAESETTKAKVRALLHEYAPAASKVPEDKRAEVLERLAKL